MRRLISERSLRRTSKRLGKNAYPRDSFQYLAYETDPSPDILVLGNWKSPTTKNNLIAGINLNYLSSGQLIRLRKASKRIFSRGALRSRYRYLKSILPDIAMFYRTYDTKYIKSIKHNQLDSYIKTKPSSKDEKVKTTADIDKAARIPEPKKDTDERIDDLDRETWRLKRRLYEPEKQRRRTSPERIGIAGSKAAKKAKATRYVRDRKKLKELERQVELAKELRKTEKMQKEPPEEPEEPEDTDELDDLGYGPEYHLDDLGYEGYNYSPDLGYIWDSTDAYIKYHRPGHKLLIEPNKPLLAVYDTSSKQFIIDSATNHAEILFDAGWDYDHTVLFEVIGSELIVKSDCSNKIISEAIVSFKRNAVKNILLESKIDPSYDPKHPEECCPSCGARLERGDDGVCNRCGKPWPEE